MRLVRRLFGRASPQSGGAGAVPSGPQPVAGVRGPLPASRAVALGNPPAMDADPGARLVGIVSDTNIDARGLARVWELFYDLPARGTQLTITLAPSPGAELTEEPPVSMSFAERPFVPPLDAGFAAGVARALNMSVEQFEAKRRELAAAERAAPLPMPFRDSPEAVADLMAQGVDFVSGPTDLVLSTDRLKNGTVVWKTGDRRRDYTTAFEAQAAG